MNLVCRFCNCWLLDHDTEKAFKKCIGCGACFMSIELINIDQYTMGRDKVYPNEWTSEVQENARQLLINLNAFLNELGIQSCQISSGWRPAAINKSIGGALKSNHMIGKACDIKDPDGKLKDLCEANDDLLKKYGLWMECRESAPTWLHLDNHDRGKRAKNIFIP